MAIQKQYLKSKPVCKVTFTVPATEAEEVKVVGDFNGWDLSELPLKKQKNGIFKGTATVPAGQEYEFRYVVDGSYVNDEEADGFRFNPYAGAENAVLAV